jgi:hypothetical protein
MEPMSDLKGQANPSLQPAVAVTTTATTTDADTHDVGILISDTVSLFYGYKRINCSVAGMLVIDNNHTKRSYVHKEIVV